MKATKSPKKMTASATVATTTATLSLPPIVTLSSGSGTREPLGALVAKTPAASCCVYSGGDSATVDVEGTRCDNDDDRISGIRSMGHAKLPAEQMSALKGRD